MRASPHGRSGALVSAGAAVRVASAVLLFLSAAEAWVAPAFLGNTALGSRHRAAGEGLLGKLGGRNGPVLRLWLGEKAVCARSRLVGMALSEESNSGGKQADRRRSTALSSSAPVGRSAEGKQGGDAPPDIAGSKRVVGSRYAGGAASFPQLVSFDDAGKMLEAIAPFLTQDSRGRYPITGCVSLALQDAPNGIHCGPVRESVGARRDRSHATGGTDARQCQSRGSRTVGAGVVFR